MLLLIPCLFAIFVNPVSLAVVWFAMLVGLLAMFVGPLPLNPPGRTRMAMRESPKPRGKAKPPVATRTTKKTCRNPRAR